MWYHTKKVIIFYYFIINFVRGTLCCSILIYFCHNYVKLKQTFILMGCDEDVWVSLCVYDMTYTSDFSNENNYSMLHQQQSLSLFMWWLGVIVLHLSFSEDRKGTGHWKLVASRLCRIYDETDILWFLVLFSNAELISWFHQTM